LAGGLVVMSAAALLAGWAPIGFSVAAVFLFAGPHNWIEARYFLSRLPARWGRLRGYFAFSFAGIIGLTATFAALPFLAGWLRWAGGDWDTAAALWNTALVGWIAILIRMRSGQNPHRDWSWTIPVAFALIAGAWIAPGFWSLGLVYLHPLM